MPYVTSIERMALAKGEAKGREEGRVEGLIEGLLAGIEGMLELRFGAMGLALLPAMREVGDAAALRSFQKAIRGGAPVEALREKLPRLGRRAPIL